MKNKKIVIIISLIVILLAAGAFFMPRHLNSDSRRIEQTYSSITWPSYLALTSKQPDDQQKYDPQLKLLWEYTYKIKTDLGHERVKEEIKSSLKKQGYPTVLEYEPTPPSQYSFEAEGKGILMTVMVGDKHDARNTNTVSVTARVSD